MLDSLHNWKVNNAIREVNRATHKLVKRNANKQIHIEEVPLDIINILAAK